MICAEATTGLADEFRVLDRRPHRGAATQRVAAHIGLIQPEVADQRGNVAGHEAHVDPSIDFGGPSVALQVGRDDLVVGRELRQDGPEHGTRAEAAVEQDERSSTAVGLVVEVEAVDVGVVTGSRRGDGRHGGAPQRVVVVSLIRPRPAEELIGGVPCCGKSAWGPIA